MNLPYEQKKIFVDMKTSVQALAVSFSRVELWQLWDDNVITVMQRDGALVNKRARDAKERDAELDS